MATTILPRIDILNARHRRLEKLELRATIQGIDTPPEVLTEIDSLKQQIATLEPATVAESHPVLLGLIMETRADVRRLYVLLPILMLMYCGLLILLVKL
jgi:hypothetical protein